MVLKNNRKILDIGYMEYSAKKIKEKDWILVTCNFKNFIKISKNFIVNIIELLLFLNCT